MEPDSVRRAGRTLVEYLVALVIIAIAAALFIPTYFRSLRQDKIDRCAGNLRRLHRAQQELLSRSPPPVSVTGKAYWLRLSQGTSPILDSPGGEVYRCPLLGRGNAGECQYLGPAVDPSTLKDADPLGCDEPFNHSPNDREGGNVLLKSGEVRTGATDLWRAATSGRRCSP